MEYRTTGTIQHKCRDCGHFRYVKPQELYHAARPRCLACGGPLEISAQGGEKTAVLRDVAAYRRDVHKDKDQ
jgi:hypothetical protein